MKTIKSIQVSILKTLEKSDGSRFKTIKRQVKVKNLQELKEHLNGLTVDGYISISKFGETYFLTEKGILFLKNNSEKKGFSTLKISPKHRKYIKNTAKYVFFPLMVFALGYFIFDYRDIVNERRDKQEIVSALVSEAHSLVRAKKYSEAIIKYDDVIPILSPRVFPNEYHDCWLNKGICLVYLSDVAERESNLLQSIGCFLQSLNISKKKLEKYMSAEAYNNLSMVYGSLSDIRDQGNNLKKSLEYIQLSAKYRDLEFDADAYVKTYSGMGQIYTRLASIEERNGNISKALNCFDKALKPKEAVSLEVLATAHKLKGDAYLYISEYMDSHGNLFKSINEYKAALKCITIEIQPDLYAQFTKDLGDAYAALANHTNRAENFILAIKNYDLALKISTYKRNGSKYAELLTSKAIALVTLSEPTTIVENTKLAIQYYLEVLKIYTIVTNPISYAISKNNIAYAYLTLAKVTHSKSLLLISIESYEECLKIINSKNNPDNYIRATKYLEEARGLITTI